MANQTFIIGKNSWGKSSLVEAIMWCLFGGEGTPKERKIRNDFYQKGQADVIVKLTLTRNEEKWQVIRRLKAGQTESDIFVIDNKKDKIDITKAFPNLTRLAHGNDAHIIFNYQGNEKPNVRDLKSFEKIISEYLGLREYDLIEETISNILKNICDNNESPYYAKKRFDALLDVSRKAQTFYEATLKEINSTVTVFGTDVVPSYQETNQRINDFISDLKELNISINDSIEASNTHELRNRLDIIKNALESELREQIRPIENLINSKNILLNKISDIKAKSSRMITRLDELNKLIDENNKKITDCEKKIFSLNIEINQLEVEKHEKESELTLLSGKLNQVDRLINILIASEQHCNQTTWNECPICDSHFENEQLKTALSDKKNRLSSQLSTELNREIQDLKSQIGVLSNIIQSKRRERDDNTICVNNNRRDLIKNRQELDKSNHELETNIQEISKLTTQEISKDNLIRVIENLIDKITIEILELEKNKNMHDALYKIQKFKLDSLYSEVHFIELEEKLNTLLLFESSQNCQKKDVALIKYITFLDAVNNILKGNKSS